LAPERLLGLGKDDFSTIPGFEVFWTWSGAHVDGAIWIRDVVIDEDGGVVSGDPDRPQHKDRKVRYFDGWAAMKEGCPEAGADAEWIGVRGLRGLRRTRAPTALTWSPPRE